VETGRVEFGVLARDRLGFGESMSIIDSVGGSMKF
jgi:hypothetical protein